MRLQGTELVRSQFRGWWKTATRFVPMSRQTGPESAKVALRLSSDKKYSTLNGGRLCYITTSGDCFAMLIPHMENTTSPEDHNFPDLSSNSQTRIACQLVDLPACSVIELSGQ